MIIKMNLNVQFLLRSLSILTILLVKPARTRVVNLDWTKKSTLFDGGYHTTTVFARLNDLLRFQCSHDEPYQIHLMKPVDALGCLIGQSEPTHLIGFCGPNTSDPRLALRSFSLMPNQPTFEAGEAYYFVAVGNSSDNKFSSHLCDNLGMRLRIHVMAKNADIQVERIEEDTKKLLTREQQKADLELVHEYNKQIHLGRIRVDDKGKDERNRDSYEDNQSTPDKHLRRKTPPTTDDTDLDYSGRGRINGQRHQIRHHSKPVDTDPPIQFRPIASDPYSLPSRTIGYDYVIGYEETSGAKSLMLQVGCAFLLPFCWILFM